MSFWGTSQFVLTILVVIGMAWFGAYGKAIKQILIWALVTTFASSLILSLHRLWPTEFVSEEFSRTGNLQLYLTWNVKYFFVDLIPLVIRTGILALGASIPARIISVRFNKPKWIGIILGLVSALVLLIPAIIASIIVLMAIIPGSWQ